MSNYFITVLNMSLTASYVVLAVMIVRLLLKKAPKIFSYALWAVVLFRLVCPFSFESTFSLIPNNSEIISHDIIYSQNPSITTGIGIADNAINQSIQSTLPPVNPADSVNPMGIALEVGAIIWILGIVMLLAYGLISYFRLKYRLSTATLVNDNIYEIDGIKTPFVLGLIKPRIYIPTNLSGSEMGYIVKHEQTHIRRYDYIIKFVSFLILVIHWFNPLIWISYFLMVKDMEMSCDESVMKQSSEDIRASYSNSLLSLSVKQSGLLSPLAFGESNIKSRIKNVLNYKKPAFWVITVTVVAVMAVVVGLIANPVRSINYNNEKYGFSVVLPKDFTDKVNINEEGNLVFFTYKEIQDMYPDMIIGVVGRIEIYDKKEMTKNQLKELNDVYNLKYLGENEKYYFGWAYPTDVQVPPNASDSIKENYRVLEEEFDQSIKTFKIKDGFNQEIVNVVEEFGSKLQMVSLQAPKDMVTNSIKENYGNLVSQDLIEKWISDPLKAPGRLTSSPWPDRIEILSVNKLSKNKYEVKGNVIEITSVEKAKGGVAAKRPIMLVVKKIDGRWLISEVTMGNYESSVSSSKNDDYSLVFGNQVISLKSSNLEVIYKTLGRPISETDEVLGSGADTFTGSHIKTLKYEGIVIKLFSPKDNPSAYWIMSMDVTGSDVQTSKGISIGSTLEQLKKAYSNLEVVPEERTDKGTYTYRVSNYEEYKYMKYVVMDGVITQIRLYVEMP